MHLKFNLFLHRVAKLIKNVNTQHPPTLEVFSSFPSKSEALLCIMQKEAERKEKIFPLKLLVRMATSNLKIAVVQLLEGSKKELREHFYVSRVS